MRMVNDESIPEEIKRYMIDTTGFVGYNASQIKMIDLEKIYPSSTEETEESE